MTAILTRDEKRALLRATIAKLAFSVARPNGAHATVLDCTFTLCQPEANYGMAPLTITLPDKRTRTGKVQTDTKGKSMWIRSNVHRLTPEAVELVTTLVMNNAFPEGTPTP